MAITDELRNHAKLYEQHRRAHIERIADNIDAAHEEALISSYFDGVFSDEELAENGFMRLPKDADGEVIHIGDKLHDEWHELNSGEVEWLMLNHHGWWLKFKDNCERFYLHDFHEWRHHKQPTVEDTLHELIGKAIMLSEVDGENELVAEYAKRLTLRGDGE